MKNNKAQLATTGLVLAVVSGLVGLIIGIQIASNDTKSSSNKTTASHNTHHSHGMDHVTDGEVVSLNGKIVCLQPKYADQPHDMSCRYGLQAEDKTYALHTDENLDVTSYAIDDEVNVRGIVAPIDEHDDTIAAAIVHVQEITKQ